MSNKKTKLHKGGNYMQCLAKYMDQILDEQDSINERLSALEKAMSTPKPVCDTKSVDKPENEVDINDKLNMVLSKLNWQDRMLDHESDRDDNLECPSPVPTPREEFKRKSAPKKGRPKKIST